MLVLDGAESHEAMDGVSLEALAYALEHKMLVVKMPSKVSDKLQVLDVSVFSATKSYFRTVRTALMQSEWIDRKALPMLCLGAYMMSATRDSIAGGFRAVGLIPFKKDWVEDHLDDFVAFSAFDRSQRIGFVPAELKVSYNL
jgi:hypothetical protein